MEIGIVGLPNVGKSTLFNALTGAQVAAKNFPFTTIDPNVGIVPLSDPRLIVLGEKFKSEKVTPAQLRFVDIAGLVKGASKGEGLGNQFLANIRAVDAIAHVVRCFHDDNVINVMETVNPLEAIDVIDTELLLADLSQAQKGLDKLKGVARSGDKKALEKQALLEKIIAGFDKGISLRAQNIESEYLAEYQFLTAKPILYVANVDEGVHDLPVIQQLRERAQKEKALVVVICAKIEAEIAQLDPQDRQAYYEAEGIVSPGLALLAKAGQQLLDQICFFTAGPKESRAWVIQRGTKAVRAAGKIHSDIERGFIRAEVYKYDDLVALGSYKEVQEKGLIYLEGKDYEVKDGDVIYFRFSV